MADSTQRDRLKKFMPAEEDVEAALHQALAGAPAAGAGEPELVALRPQTLVRGRVLRVETDRVLVDLSWKSEGVIPRDEFGEEPPLEGSEVEAFVVALADAGGQVLLSVTEAARRKVWAAVAAGDRSRIIDGRVVEAVKGGLVVDIGIRAFMPAREADLHYVEDLGSLVGSGVRVRILEADAADRRVIVSRRSVLSEERARQREELFRTLEVGATVKGRVTRVMPFGAFVDIGGAEGLLHIGDLSWTRVEDPAGIVSPGQELQVRVLSLDRQSGKIGLGLKQITASPWDGVEQRFPTGRRVRGRVAGIMPFGALVEIEPGVQGLVHVSELSWSTRVRTPESVVSLGDELEVEVLTVDPAKKRISLSAKRVEANPWASLESRFPFATIVHGTVTSLEDFGAFVTLDEGVEGLVHISELSWAGPVKHPGDVVKVGERVTAIVLSSDEERRRLSLSIKQTEPDPWSEAAAKYPPGRVVTGEVVRVEPFGAFVRLEPGCEGLIHVSRMAEGRGRRPAERLRVGAKLAVEVLEVDPERRRLALSPAAADGGDGAS